MRNAECPHLRITQYVKSYVMATCYEPEEYEYYGRCDECGVFLDPSDYPDKATIRDRYGRIERNPIVEAE